MSADYPKTVTSEFHNACFEIVVLGRPKALVGGLDLLLLAFAEHYVYTPQCAHVIHLDNALRIECMELPDAYLFVVPFRGGANPVAYGLEVPAPSSDAPDGPRSISKTHAKIVGLIDSVVRHFRDVEGVQVSRERVHHCVLEWFLMTYHYRIAKMVGDLTSIDWADAAVSVSLDRAAALGFEIPARK